MLQLASVSGRPPQQEGRGGQHAELRVGRTARGIAPAPTHMAAALPPMTPPGMAPLAEARQLLAQKEHEISRLRETALQELEAQVGGWGRDNRAHGGDDGFSPMQRPRSPVPTSTQHSARESAWHRGGQGGAGHQWRS